MISGGKLADAVRAAEPQFQLVESWSGYWTLAGRPAYLRLDGDWLEARTPLCGEAREALSSQRALAGLAKVAEDDFLRAEAPAAGDYEAVFRLLRSELERALDFFEGVPLEARVPALTPEWVAERLHSTGLSWRRNGARFLTPLDEDPTPSCYAVAEAMGSALALRVGVARLNGATRESLDALARFALVVNGTIRMARLSLDGGKATLEVVLPPGRADRRMICAAVGALRAGAAAARRECRALANAEIARAYLQFHSKGAEK